MLSWLTSMLTPLPTQISGARFLADRKHALLADAPRVGKTGAAIIAADYIFARTILVVTTASGRGVWERGFETWSTYGRHVQILTSKTPLRPDAGVVIVGWPSISDARIRVQLLTRHWDLIIADESHAAKSFGAKRTQAFYGEMLEDGGRIMVSTSVAGKGERVWCLTGTPLPNSPLDIYPQLRTLAVERLLANEPKGWPEVVTLEQFKKRYVKIKPKKIGTGAYARWIDVPVGGRNEAELAARLESLVLRRTQADVGIRPPVYETFPLLVSQANRRAVEAGVDASKVLAAAERGDTKELELDLGPLRRLTGEIKARAIVEAVEEEFDGGLDKIVLAYWHKDVGAILKEGLKRFGVVGIDGSTSPYDRQAAQESFRHDPKTRVFLAQIAAAGEAIDLSAASELIFVEQTFMPSQMRQMSDRITNIEQARLTRVRVATLAGSVDDALQTVLLRKWSSIRKVLS
jgi:SWI/SNF-related matrix-associated actin-dependent regulator of chromatin subfamily A-like protein 1